MEIELNHFKTRAVFDRISKQYLDISFIQDTEQVHTHDHIYLFVTPDMKGKLDNIKRISAQEFNNLQEPLEDGFYIYDDKGLLTVAQVEENSSTISIAHIILDEGVKLYKWNTNTYELIGKAGELDINLDLNNAVISSIITPNDTSEIEIPAATTTTAGLLSASDKIKINNTIPTCTAQQADGVSLESGMYYCPERNIIYYFSNNLGEGSYRIHVNKNNNDFGLVTEIYRDHQWREKQQIGKLSVADQIGEAYYLILKQNTGAGVSLINLPNATNTQSGCMSFEDKNKLDNIREFTEEKEEVIAHSLNDLNSRVTELSENNTNLSEDIEETERVISLSLNDLNSRLNELNEIVEENELITASALNDLNERVGSGTNNNQEIPLKFVSIEEDAGDVVQSFSNLSAINKEFIDMLYDILSNDDFNIKLIKLKSIAGGNVIYYNFYPNSTTFASSRNRGAGDNLLVVINTYAIYLPNGSALFVSIKLTLGDSNQLIINYYDGQENDEIIYNFSDVGTDNDGTEYYSLTKYEQK